MFTTDDAFAKIKTGNEQQQPCDLLITDLSFEEDRQVQQLFGGMELITAARLV